MKNTVLELAEAVIHDAHAVSEDEAMDLYQSDAPEELFSAAEKSFSYSERLICPSLPTGATLMTAPVASAMSCHGTMFA